MSIAASLHLHCVDVAARQPMRMIERRRLRFAHEPELAGMLWRFYVGPCPLSSAEVLF
jgi:hypothetical protein